MDTHVLIVPRGPASENAEWLVTARALIAGMKASPRGVEELSGGTRKLGTVLANGCSLRLQTPPLHMPFGVGTIMKDGTIIDPAIHVAVSDDGDSGTYAAVLHAVRGPAMRRRVFRCVAACFDAPPYIYIHIDAPPRVPRIATYSHESRVSRVSRPAAHRLRRAPCGELF